MCTVSVLLTLILPSVRSLKEKRAVVRSLVARLQSRLGLTAAEVGAQDLLQRAQVGFAVVSAEPHEARRLANQARHFADQELLGRAEVIDVEVGEAVMVSSL